jgi:hypothetical protein
MKFLFTTAVGDEVGEEGEAACLVVRLRGFSEPDQSYYCEKYLLLLILIFSTDITFECLEYQTGS